jgi:hypothetical protein
VQDEAVVVRDHANLLTVRHQLANILYYLDGKCAPQELSNAPINTPENATIAHNSQISLLDCSLMSQPPAYLTHLGSHLSGVANAPGAPADQVQRAIQINKNLSPTKAWLQKVRADALQLSVMNDAQLGQALALRSDIATQANNVMSGGFDAATQASVPSAAQIVSQMQLLATFEVTPYKAQ